MPLQMAALTLAAALPALGLATDGPWTIVNLDNNYYTGTFGDADMTVEKLTEHVDGYLGGSVTHLFVNPQGMRAGYDSKVLEPFWKALDEPGATSYPFMRKAKLLHDRGIDLYDVWIRRARERGVEGWVSMRMDDTHCVDDLRSGLLSTFWLRRQDLWCQPFSQNRSMIARGFDYAHKDVRDHHLAVVAELLERYDVDGIDLDWTRMPDCLTVGRGRELHGHLTDFMREARKLVNAAAGRRGHPIKVAATVMLTPAIARGYGTDFETWAREGLIDALLVGNRWMQVDFNCPWQEFRRLVSAANPKVRVIPRPDTGTCKDLCDRLPMTLDEYCGFLERLQSQNCRDFAYFNLFFISNQYIPTSDVHDFIYKGAGATPERVRAHRRVYPASYLDGVPTDLDGRCLYGLSSGASFPFAMKEARTVRIEIGSAVGVGEVFVNAAFGTVPKAVPALTLNGTLATSSDAGYKPFWLKGKRLTRAIRYVFPSSALRDGVNEIGFPVSSGDEACYCELEVAPRD